MDVLRGLRSLGEVSAGENVLERCFLLEKKVLDVDVGAVVDLRSTARIHEVRVEKGRVGMCPKTPQKARACGLMHIRLCTCRLPLTACVIADLESAYTYTYASSTRWGGHACIPLHCCSTFNQS
jgi:hypothetical protein